MVFFFGWLDFWWTAYDYASMRYSCNREGNTVPFNIINSRFCFICKMIRKRKHWRPTLIPEDRESDKKAIFFLQWNSKCDIHISNTHIWCQQILLIYISPEAISCMLYRNVFCLCRILPVRLRRSTWIYNLEVNTIGVSMRVIWLANIYTTTHGVNEAMRTCQKCKRMYEWSMTTPAITFCFILLWLIHFCSIYHRVTTTTMMMMILMIENRIEKQ